MLAGNPHGVSDNLLVLAHGFDGDMIANLVHTGLATKHGETITAGGPPIEVVRVRITEAGRNALAAESS
jgi:hypothetical protein